MPVTMLTEPSVFWLWVMLIPPRISTLLPSPVTFRPITLNACPLTVDRSPTLMSNVPSRVISLLAPLTVTPVSGVSPAIKEFCSNSALIFTLPAILTVLLSPLTFTPVAPRNTPSLSCTEITLISPSSVTCDVLPLTSAPVPLRLTLIFPLLRKAFCSPATTKPTES